MLVYVLFSLVEVVKGFFGRGNGGSGNGDGLL